MNSFHIYISANINMWLVCSEKDKAKYSHDYYELKNGSCMAMIDLEDCYYNIYKYGTIKD